MTRNVEYLKLVNGIVGDGSRRAVCDLDVRIGQVTEQLSFEFMGEGVPDRLIVLIVMGAIHGRTLHSLIHELKPKLALDLRYAIRFDLPGTDRATLFRQFGAYGTMYSRSSIAWHELSVRDFILSDRSINNRLQHEIVERVDSPMFVLIEKQADAVHLHSYLNRQLSEKCSVSWSVVRQPDVSHQIK